MSDRLMTSIVLYGTIKNREMVMWEWYQYFMKLNEKLGYTSTHLGIRGESFKSGKLTTIKRTETKFKKACENGTDLKSVSIYALPQEFTQAAFDYYSEFVCIYESLNSQFIISTVPSEDFNEMNRINLLNDLKDIIDCRECEVFELSVLECPLIYAYKVNEPSNFKSLKIIEKIEF